MSAIEVSGLVKHYTVSERAAGTWGAIAGLVRRQHRKVEALGGVDFTINEGELIGYIGPNGAGKSTTVKILCGILLPTSGHCLVFGRVPWKKRVEHVRRIGVVFGQKTQLWWDLPVRESFDLIASIYRLDRVTYRQNLDSMIQMFDLSSLLNRPVRQLSLGQRMRCELTAALVHDPEVIFLDEPTIGLDAPSKIAIRDFIRRVNQERRKTVILTTHDMDDIEALCRRVLVIGEGKILLDGQLETLRSKVSRDRILRVDLGSSFNRRAIEGARVVAVDGHQLTLLFDPDQVPVTALIQDLARGNSIRDLFVEHVPIEQVVARFYQEVRP